MDVQLLFGGNPKRRSKAKKAGSSRKRRPSRKKLKTQKKSSAKINQKGRVMSKKKKHKKSSRKKVHHAKRKASHKSKIKKHGKKKNPTFYVMGRDGKFEKASDYAKGKLSGLLGKKKNPAFHIIGKDGKVEKELGYISSHNLGKLTNIVNRAKKIAASATDTTAKAHAQKIVDFAMAKIAKQKQERAEAKDTARYDKKHGGATIKFEKSTAADALLTKQIDNLNKLLQTAEKNMGAVVAKKRKSKKKKAKKSHKKKSLKKRSSKKKSHKKSAKKAKKSSAKKSRKGGKRSSKAAKALKRAHKKAHAAIRTVAVIKKMKKGQSRKVRVDGKKMTLKRKNPIGGQMTKEIKLIGHSGAEVAGLALGGLAISTLNKLVDKVLPASVKDMINKVPVVGPILKEVALPAAAAVAAHKYSKSEVLKQLTKGLLGAVVVKTASGLVDQVMPAAAATTALKGFGNVMSFPIRRGMGDVVATPNGKADFDLAGIPQMGHMQLGEIPTVATPKDFGYRPDQMNYDADFNGVPEREGFSGGDEDEGQMG